MYKIDCCILGGIISQVFRIGAIKIVQKLCHKFLFLAVGIFTLLSACAQNTAAIEPMTDEAVTASVTTVVETETPTKFPTA
ncbi:MAG: hypothetical protein P8046_08975, partial [Anaerolineales bacterium]